MKIYVASSWRNELQQHVVDALRKAGHEVYDFRHPAPGNDGFHWSEIDERWKDWGPEEFRKALDHPIARRGFACDMDALLAADATVLVLPCGRSAHLELGYAAGRRQRTYVLATSATEPELMYLMCSSVVTSIEELIAELAKPQRLF